MEKPIYLTVFTPTYNRIKTLERTYQSMLNQKNKAFIWMIVDDGSTDETGEVVKQWQAKDNGFEIQYIYKENGGMHTAHNTAYANIKTELNTCIDSDDCLAEDAVDIILATWEKHRDKGYAGIIGLDADMEGKIIGTKFKKDLSAQTLIGFYEKGGKGDKKLVYRTDVITKYPPYPVFEGEKYVGLNYKYLLCDEEYHMLAINQVLCNVDYQPDGSSRTMYKQYYNNPKGWIFYRKFAMQHRKQLRRVFLECIHYVSSCKIAEEKAIIENSPRKVLTAFAYPFGCILYRYIKHKQKKQ